MAKKCLWHLCEIELSGRRTVFCSNKCRNKYYVDKRRKALKIKAVAYKGGKCERCGYDKCIKALSFHHPGKKDFGISQRGHTRAWEKIRRELRKCELLCLNCHTEQHDAELENV